VIIIVEKIPTQRLLCYGFFRPLLYFTQVISHLYGTINPFFQYDGLLNIYLFQQTTSGLLWNNAGEINRLVRYGRN